MITGLNPNLEDSNGTKCCGHVVGNAGAGRRETLLPNRGGRSESRHRRATAVIEELNP
jgi:hypothetical protein